MTFPARFASGDQVRIQASGLTGTIEKLLTPSVVAKEQPYSVKLTRGGFTMALDSEIELTYDETRNLREAFHVGMRNFNPGPPR